jgi:hypothetical protein
MPMYLIVHNPSLEVQVRNQLLDALRQGGNATWPCMNGAIIVDHAGPALAIRNVLLPHIDSSENLLIFRVSGEWSWIGFRE